MQSLSWYYKRLRSMSPIEVASRVYGTARAFVDVPRARYGWYPALALPAGTTLQGLQAGFEFPDIAVDQLDDAQLDRLTAAADEIVDARLSFFQHDRVNLGKPIDWHRDWNLGKAAPRGHITFIDYRDVARSGDCKQVWEPNRHHQFLVLARAFVATRNPVYAQSCVEQMLSWIDSNPFGYGMNWKSPLELGIRSINWVWALALLKREGFEIDAAPFGRIAHTLELLIWETNRKLSSGTSANNHLIGELAGVYVGLRFLPYLSDKYGDSARCKAELQVQMAAQTLADGCGAEHAFGYQYFVVQFHVACLQAARGSGDTFSSAFTQRLVDMGVFVARLSQHTGRCPMLGDHDDGRVLDLGDPADSTQALLAAIVAVVPREQAARLVPFMTSACETSIWLGAQQHCPDGSPAPQGLACCGFVPSGYYLLQQTYADQSSVSVLMDAAELGYGAIAAHGHADALSIVLSINGHPVFVDPDTYDYFTYPEWRRYFKSTQAHNTLEVDVEDQSEAQGPFLWGSRALTTVHHFVDAPDQASVKASHDGYHRLPDALTHTREVRLDKIRREVTITDALDCAEAHSAVSHFHTHPDCNVEIEQEVVKITFQNNDVILHPPAGTRVSVVRGSEATQLGWYSDGYHQKRPAATICIATTCTASTHLLTRITW